MAQTKRPDAGHIPYMVSIKIFNIYPFYALIFKNLHYGLWRLQSGITSSPLKIIARCFYLPPIFGDGQFDGVI